MSVSCSAVHMMSLHFRPLSEQTQAYKLHLHTEKWGKEGEGTREERGGKRERGKERGRGRGNGGRREGEGGRREEGGREKVERWMVKTCTHMYNVHVHCM